MSALPANDPYDAGRITLHGRAFLTFVVALLERKAFAIPPNVSVDGLAAAFDKPEFRHALGQLLTTLALQRLVSAAPPVPPDLVLADGRLLRAAPWDEALAGTLDWDVHQRTIAVLAQLFLVGSAMFGKREDGFDADDEFGKAMLDLAADLHTEGKRASAKSVAKQSPLVWPSALANHKRSLTALASIPPGRMFPKNEPMGPVDLIVLDESIRAVREVLPKIQVRVENLNKYWDGILERAMEISPLTQLLAEDPVALPAPADGRRGRERCAAALGPLFTNGNHHLVRFIEAMVIDAWISVEESRRQLDDSLWGDRLSKFTDIVFAFMSLAESTGHASTLTLVPRFFHQYFQKFKEEFWYSAVRRGMNQRRRFAERQEFAKSELSAFDPLREFANIIHRLRSANFAERSDEENFLIQHPLSQVEPLLTRVRFCRQKLELPFATTNQPRA